MSFVALPKNLLVAVTPKMLERNSRGVQSMALFLLTEIRRRVQQQSLVFAGHQECCHQPEGKVVRGRFKGRPKMEAMKVEELRPVSRRCEVSPVSAGERPCNLTSQPTSVFLNPQSVFGWASRPVLLKGCFSVSEAQRTGP